MRALYTKGTIICKLWEQFSQYFSEQTKPTARHLFEMSLSMLALNGYQSVRFNHQHFIEKISKSSLNSFYYALNNSKIDLNDWRKALIHAALAVIPEELRSLAVVLAIDDTLIEKDGTSFDHYSTLFDHTAKNGSNYLKGHCFVSIVLNVPVIENGKKKYLSIPIGYRMWDKEQTKLEIAAELVKNAMAELGKKRQVILCCDSWYPKAPVTDLVDEFSNLTLICNARIDTALYHLPEPKKGRGRPRVYGRKFVIDEVPLQDIQGTDYQVGTLPVKTKLFGRRTVYMTLTKPKKGDSYRLFLCTSAPETLKFDIDCIQNSSATYAKADISLLPLTIYSIRWSIEVTYYEQKTFWSLGNYMLQHKDGIEHLVNLISLVFAAVRLLPFQSQDFSTLLGVSVQEARFMLGQLVNQQVFFDDFARSVETGLNSVLLADLLKYQGFDSFCSS